METTSYLLERLRLFMLSQIKLRFRNADQVFLGCIAGLFSFVLGYIGYLEYITSSGHSLVLSLALSAMFGAAVGFSEIVSRYRDEPIRACRCFYGLYYIFLNALISISAGLVIWHYPDKFNFSRPHPDVGLAALLAGFGGPAVMRTRLMVLKSSDNKDISIGPDIVIKQMLTMVDSYIDRIRASFRLHLVSETLPKLFQLRERLGSFRLVADYLSAALLSLQNLDDENKKQLDNIFNEYDKQPLPEPVKLLAMGLVFLTVVGEDRYSQIVADASLNFPEQPPASDLSPAQAS